jgi:hypothetical protein
MRRRLADLLTALALRLYPDAAMFDLDDEGRMRPDQWAGLIILHAEAVHGCEHTDQARRELGMAGPRGERASA